MTTTNTATTPLKITPLISGWVRSPIPHFTLSASGLLALADLRTVADRTAITGGSSWLDAFVLSPGIHYQQACDRLDKETPSELSALADGLGGRDLIRYAVNNNLTANYLARLARNSTGGTLTLDVGMIKPRTAREMVHELLWKRQKPPPKTPYDEESDEDDLKVITAPNIDLLSHLLYVLSPLLTLASILFMILLADWWGLVILLSMMLSRMLNIWAIKNRSQPLPPSPITRVPESKPNSSGPVPDEFYTEYRIDFGSGHAVHLRGLDADLQALTTQAWLRDQSALDSYLEAAAKLIIYLGAALSGNMSQAGSLDLMALLIVSAALLGLSNAHARGFRVHGRFAVPSSNGSIRAQPRQERARRYRGVDDDFAFMAASAGGGDGGS